MYCFVAPDYHISAWLSDRRAPIPLVPPGSSVLSNVSPLGSHDEQTVVGLWSMTLGDPTHGFFAKRRGARFDVTSYDVPWAYSTKLTGINDEGDGWQL